MGRKVKHTNYRLLLMILVAGLMASLLSLRLFTPQLAQANIDSPFQPVPTATLSETVILVSGDDHYAPFEFNENGQPTGFNIDLIRAVARQMNLNIVIQLAPWGQARDDLENGRVDILAGMYYSEDRAQQVNFSIPHTMVSSGLFVRQNSAIKSFEDIKDRAIIVQQGDLMDDYLQTRGEVGRIVYAVDPPSALRLLAAGEYDGVLLSSEIQGWYLSNKMGLNNLRVVKTPVEPQQYGFAVSKDNPQLLFQLNEGLNILKSNGEYKKIYDRWFGIYEQKSFLSFISHYSYLFVIALLAAFGSLLWIWTLRREIKNRSTALIKSEEKYRVLLEHATEGVVVISGDILAYVNPRACQITGYSETELLSIPIRDLIHSEDRQIAMDNILRRLNGDIRGTSQYSLRLYNKQGEIRWIDNNSVVVEWDGKPAVLDLFTDITEQHHAQQELLKSEQRFRLLYMEAPLGYQSLDEQGAFLDVNPAWLEMLGYMHEEVIGHNFVEFLTPESREVFPDRFTNFKKAGSVHGVEFAMVRKDGDQFTASFDGRIAFDEEGKFIQTHCILTDITERKKAERALRLSEDKFAKAFWSSPDAVTINRMSDGLYLDINEGFTTMTGYTMEDVDGKTSSDIDIWADPADRHRLIQGLQRDGSYRGLETMFRMKDGSLIVGLMSARVINVAGEPGLIAVTQNITERKKAEERIQRQLDYLAALRSIDLAITASIDLSFTLRVLLEQISTRLAVDAADVLLLDEKTQTLRFAADRGFLVTTTRNTRLHLGTGYAGKVALERAPLYIQNLQDTSPEMLSARQLVREGFVTYFALPLIAKGLVKGVLEIYHRATLDPDPEWLNFLDALAGQAAIAIDNASLFDGLQQANTELTLAYDATIEGWARALELRDGETEGHSRRVTELTIGLARKMGISEEDLVHVRHGALLHDIGKMGIPDQILLKPGSLTEEEWVIMRKHPEYSYKLLSSIQFLHSALDIPYCHHERWNGSGYPRGLKGTEIPLEARVFAVIDVWDALSSDRPYRKGWEKRQVLQYIQDQADILFDPTVVTKFFELIASDDDL